MKLKHNDTVRGYSAKKLRDFFGGKNGAFRSGDHIKSKELPYYAQLHFGADAMMVELFKRGWLVRAEIDNVVIQDAHTKCGTLREPIISLSQIGKQSRARKFTKRFSRQVGEKIVMDLIARAEAINSCDDFLYVVWELTLFGSMLDPEIQALGDVYVAYDIRSKVRGESWPERNVTRAKLMGFGHISYFDMIFFGRTEVKRHLENRNARLSMMDKFDFDKLEPRPKSKTIYTARGWVEEPHQAVQDNVNPKAA